MKTIKRLNKNQFGFGHVELVAFVLVVGVISLVGVRVIKGSHAATITSTGSAPFAGAVAQPAAEPLKPVSTNFDPGAAMASNPNGRNFEAIENFKSNLQTQYPNQYAGLVTNSDGSTTVLVTSNSAALDSTASAGFNTVATNSNASDAYANSPKTLSYKTVKYSFNTLNGILQDINKTAKLGKSPYNMTGAYINEANNNIVVTTTNSTTTTLQNYLSTKYEKTNPSSIAVYTGTADKALNSRIEDAAPWTAGDETELLDNYSNYSTTYCTVGAGIHDTVNNYQFSLTAGHCGDSTPWGYWVPTIASNHSFIGQTMLYSDHDKGNPNNPGFDEELIYTSPTGGSSDNFWVGGINAAGNVKYKNVGYYDPPDGTEVCKSGSFSGTSCGWVVSTDSYMWESVDGGPCYVGCTTPYIGPLLNVVINCTSGDSGSPVYDMSGYGPLFVGTLIAGYTSGGYSFCQVEPASTILYIYSIEYQQPFAYDTVANP